MITTVLSQTHILTDDECQRLCQQLVDGFATSVQQGDGEKFQATLTDVLQRTAIGEDDAHIWQEAVSLLGTGAWGGSTSAALVHEILNNAQFTISAQMQRQYRQYVLHERWTSSRLSLLTDCLIDALDEPQIYEMLAKHLPDLDIHIATLALFEAEESDFDCMEQHSQCYCGSATDPFSEQGFSTVGVVCRYWLLELASDTERADLDSIDYAFAVMSRRI